MFCPSLSPLGATTATAIPGYGYLPTASTAASADRLSVANAAAAAAGFYTDYAATSPGGVSLAAANAAAIPRSDPSPLPLSSSPLSQRTAGT